MGNGNEPENPPKKPVPAGGSGTGAGTSTDSGTGGGGVDSGKSNNAGIKPLDDVVPPQSRKLLRAAQTGGAMGGFIGGLIGGLIGACLCCFLHH
jgi:hypothetical protein